MFIRCDKSVDLNLSFFQLICLILIVVGEHLGYFYNHVSDVVTTVTTMYGGCIFKSINVTSFVSSFKNYMTV